MQLSRTKYPVYNIEVLCVFLPLFSFTSHAVSELMFSPNADA